jgi:hypothetical protein
MSVRDFIVTLLILLLTLTIAASGVLGLIARRMVPNTPPRRQLMNSWFRLVAGLLMTVVAVASLIHSA